VIVLDLQGLLHDSATPLLLPRWKTAAQLVHGADTEVLFYPAERMRWLKQLATEDIWGEVTIVADRADWLFWRLVDPKIIVQDEAGKRMPKAWRTADPELWAYGLIAEDHRKGAIGKLMRLHRGEPNVHVEALLRAFNESDSEGKDLIETDGVYTMVSDITYDAVWAEIIAHISKGGWWCWDTETEQTGEDDNDAPNPWDAEIVGLSLGIVPGKAWYFPIAHRDPETDEPRPWNLDRSDVFQLLIAAYTQTDSRRVITHNTKYDFQVVTNQHQQLPWSLVFNDWLEKTWDTMLMAQVANFPRAGLKPLAETELQKHVIDFKRLTAGKSFAYVDAIPATVYAGQDADWPLQLWPILEDRLTLLEVNHIYQQDYELTRFFARLESHGVRINRTLLAQKLAESQEDLGFWSTLFFRQLAEAGVDYSWAPLQFNKGKKPDPNLGSDKQVAIWLFDAAPHGLGLQPTARTGTGAPSTSEKAINAMLARDDYHVCVKMLLKYREFAKRIEMIESIFKNIRADGRIHATFRILGADATGRTSCHDINLQQVEKYLREVFEPEDGGTMAGLDYSQIELRVLAAEFYEPKMLETYNLPRFLPNGEENPDADIHGRTQREVGFTDRRPAKVFNFGKAFGAGAPTLSAGSGFPVPVVEQFIARFDAAYPDYTANLRARRKQARKDHGVRNWKGRWRGLTYGLGQKIDADNDRLVANTPVQGGAADIIKDACRRIDHLLDDAANDGIYAWNFVHDEVDFQCEARTSPERWVSFLQDVQDIMMSSNPFEELLPLGVDVEVGPNWLQLRKPDDDVYGLNEMRQYTERVEQGLIPEDMEVATT